MIHIWSVDTSAAHGRFTSRAWEENFSSSHAGSLTMKKSSSLFCGEQAREPKVRCSCAETHRILSGSSAAPPNQMIASQYGPTEAGIPSVKAPRR